MPIKNPFRKSAAVFEAQDVSRDSAEAEFQQAIVRSTKPPAIGEPVEYEFSEINDSGVYLPPPLPEKKTYFSRSSTSTSYSTRGSESSDMEPFSISRESFDSYRRSFDISARSPIPSYDTRPRQSIDSRRGLSPHSSLRTSFQSRSIDRPNAPLEEGFEEVGLYDEVKPKKKGLFARFGDSADTTAPLSPDARPTPSYYNFNLFQGRKRGQSGQGAELGNIPRPSSNHALEVGGI